LTLRAGQRTLAQTNEIIKAITVGKILVSHEAPTNLTAAWASFHEPGQNRLRVLEAGLSFEFFSIKGLRFIFLNLQTNGGI